MKTTSQLSTTEPKKQKQKQTRQRTRTGTESQKCRSHGGLPTGKESRENGGESTRNNKHNWESKNKQGEVKNSMGNGEAKELICTTHGHELRWGNVGRRGCRVDGKNETTVIA